MMAVIPRRKWMRKTCRHKFQMWCNRISSQRWIFCYQWLYLSAEDYWNCELQLKSSIVLIAISESARTGRVQSQAHPRSPANPKRNNGFSLWHDISSSYLNIKNARKIGRSSWTTAELMFQLMSQKLYSSTTNKPSSSEVINEGIIGLGGALYLPRNQVMHTNFTPMIAMYFDILRYFTDRPNIP